MSSSEPPQRNLNVELVEFMVDNDDKQVGKYRFVVDGKHIKYLAVEPGCLPKDGRTDERVLLQNLPEFPPGDWSEGHVLKDQRTGLPSFSKIKLPDIPSIEDVWHDVKIERSELKFPKRGQKQIVSHPSFTGHAVLKLAHSELAIGFLENETGVYGFLEGTGIAPRFLGHVTEYGNVVGFLREDMEGYREAIVGTTDVYACNTTLKRLHDMGCRYVQPRKESFLVGKDGAFMIDFMYVTRCRNEEKLRKERERFQESMGTRSYFQLRM